MLATLLWKLIPTALLGVAQASRLALVVQEPSQTTYADIKVPVTLGVMSRCPDALLCESVFDHVLRKVADKVDLSLTFIGTINATEPTYGVTCMHGPDECAGNIQELCAIKYAPTKQWWQFVQCQNFQGREKIGLPETAQQCAHAAEIDWEESGVGTCASIAESSEGIQLLHESVRATQKLGVKKSCTILINGKQVCIHDSTWKECEGGHRPDDFVRQINEEYDRLNGDDEDSKAYN